MEQYRSSSVGSPTFSFCNCSLKLPLAVVNQAFWGFFLFFQRVVETSASTFPSSFMNSIFLSQTVLRWKQICSFQEKEDPPILQSESFKIDQTALIISDSF